MKAKLKINVNIGLMCFLLVGIAICVFLTSRDLYYAIQVFFGLHKDESTTLLYISSFGFEVAVLIYSLSNNEKNSWWKDYVFVVSSAIINTTYLCYAAYNKEGSTIAHYISAVVLGCIFPVIVVWLSVLFRGYFWATVQVKEDEYNEVLLSEKLAQELKIVVQDKEKLESQNKALVQDKEKLEREKQGIVQSKGLSEGEKTQLVQEKEKLVQENKTLESEKELLVQHQNQLVQEVAKQKELASKAVQDNLLSVQALTLERDKVKLVTSMEQSYKDEIKRLQALLQRKPTLVINGNIDLQASLIRKYKDYQNKDEEIAQQALQNYKDLVEKNIILS